MLRVIWNVFALLTILASLETFPLKSSELFNIIIFEQIPTRVHLFKLNVPWKEGKKQHKPLPSDPISQPDPESL